EDEKVFAVIGIEFFYQAGADCVARQFRTPLITSEGPGDDVYARATPLLFSLQPSEDRLLHNFVQWAADDVQHRYRMAYTPTNQKQDGTWRAISLTTNDSTHKIRTRPGYQSGMPPPVRPSLEFTAINDAQEYVDLDRGDIDVVEDGVKQSIDVFQEAVAPVTIMLALDVSGSMR